MANTKHDTARPAAHMQCRSRTAIAFCVITIALLTASCSDEQVSEPTAPTPYVAEHTAQTHALEWLKRTDPVDADLWLASREAGADLEPHDPAVARMHSTLETAAQRFRDHPRMIANRAVQLEAMLKEKGIDERAPAIILTLCEVPGNTRFVESFSSLTQQYYNLRLEGLDRAQAIKALRKQHDSDL